MKNITIYNVATGNILKSFSKSYDFTDIDSMLEDGEAYIEGKFIPSIYEKIIDGEAVLKDTTPDYEKENRFHRSALLYGSDWTQMPDSPLSESKKTEWATYRQALRDLPTNSNWPNLEDGDWPTEPT